MRRYLFFLILVFSFCFVQTSEARKLALLVGVDKYDDVPSLTCCVNDVKVLKDALMKVGFQEDDIQILATGSDDYPTKKRIERKLREIFEMAGPHDMVFLSFSGHGAQDGKKVYFCPPDVDVEDLDGTCVSIDQVMRDLEKCKAQFKWVVVDACRNDPADAARSIGGKGLQVIPTPPAGIALFQSCAKGEQSWEDRASGNGFFTKNFAAALSGEADANHDGQLTLMEVCTWTTAQTKEQVMASQNKSQKPYFSGTVSDFTLTEDLNVPKAKALAQQAHEKVKKREYAEAIRLYDEAIHLYPKFNSWKRDRDNAQTLLEAEERIKKAEQKVHEAAKTQPTSEEMTLQEPPRLTPTETTLPASSLKPGSKAGERMVLRADDIEYAFRWCPPGEFMMGSTNGNPDEKPVHKVELTKGFWLLETEVTQEMWESVMGNNPSQFEGDKNPVERVSWNDCQSFCKKISQKLDQQIQLPTEAQWEYACRAGIMGDYAGDLDSMAWYSKNSGLQSHAIGQKKPNVWGLYDMNGNVREWCSDSFDKDFYSRSPTCDPENSTTSPLRMHRGGGWDDDAEYCRSASRRMVLHGYLDSDLGLRVLAVPSQD